MNKKDRQRLDGWTTSVCFIYSVINLLISIFIFAKLDLQLFITKRNKIETTFLLQENKLKQ